MKGSHFDEDLFSTAKLIKIGEIVRYSERDFQAIEVINVYYPFQCGRENRPD